MWYNRKEKNKEGYYTMAKLRFNKEEYKGLKQCGPNLRVFCCKDY